MNQDIAPYRRVVAKAAILSAVVSVLVIGAAYGLAHLLGKPMLAGDIAGAGGVLVLAGVPGLVLSVAMTGRVRGGASMGFVAGIVVRLPVGGVLAFYGLNWGLAKTQSFSQVVATTYLVLLVIEVIFLSPAVKRTAAAEAKTAPPVEASAGDQESV